MQINLLSYNNPTERKQVTEPGQDDLLAIMQFLGQTGKPPEHQLGQDVGPSQTSTQS